MRVKVTREPCVGQGPSEGGGGGGGGGDGDEEEKWKLEEKRLQLVMMITHEMKERFLRLSRGKAS